MTTDPEMPAATLEALRGSIAKWEGIVAGTVKNECGDNCPLCGLFNPTISQHADRRRPCGGCPVRAWTTQAFCRGTPYEFYEDLQEQLDELDPDLEEDQPRIRSVRLQMDKFAQREVDFLKSLLPGSATCPQRMFRNEPEDRKHSG